MTMNYHYPPSIFDSARWISRPNSSADDPVPAPYFRNNFHYTNTGESLVLLLAGLGYHEIYLNGEKISDHLLTPPPEMYSRHYPYCRYDLSGKVREGENQLLILLGNGWYNCQTVFHRYESAIWRTFPKLVLKLLQGETPLLVSDESWRTGDSPILFNALRNGEFFDGRMLEPDFYRKGRPETEQPAAIVQMPGGRPRLVTAPAVRVLEYLMAEPVSSNVWKIPKNIAGWCSLRLRGTRGTTVSIRYCDRITRDGQIDWGKYKLAVKSGEFQTDRYTLSGNGVEFYEPRFTYHGFQYMEITGDGDFELLEVKAASIGSDFAVIGSFKTGNPVIEALRKCTYDSFRSNFVHIPTDCPHREKDGWTADAHCACETGMYHFDLTENYRAWLDILCDSQFPSGQLPGIAPCAGFSFYENWTSPAWDYAFIKIPYTIFLHNHDRRIIHRYYKPMCRYYNFFHRLSDSQGIVDYGILGEWCGPTNVKMVDKRFVSTVFCYHSALLLGHMATAIRKNEDAKEFYASAGRMKEAIISQFGNPDGSFCQKESTALALALEFGLVEGENQKNIAGLLAEHVKHLNGKADFGILGAKYVPRALANNGYADLGLLCFTQPEYPGWANWVKRGAVTLWEDWEGENSHNHIMFGDINAWFFEFAAGFRYYTPGRLTICPTPLKALGSFQADYRHYRSRWAFCGSTCQGEIFIPKGKTANLLLPDGRGIDNAQGTISWEAFFDERLSQ